MSSPQLPKLSAFPQQQKVASSSRASEMEPQSPKPKVNNVLAPLSEDTVSFSTHALAEPLNATELVDGLLTECDQMPATERMTFRDFLVKAAEEPMRYLPTASSYVLDAFQHYDGPDGPKSVRAYGETMPRFRLLDGPWNQHLQDPMRIVGQEPTVNRMLEIIRSFKQQPNPDRCIAFFGPHGSGKSIIPKTIMAGVENYSKQDAGKLWTFSFVFPKDSEKKSEGSHNALLEPEQIASQLPANLKLNPIFLLPPKQRTQFLKTLQEKGKITPDFNMDYYLKSNPDSYTQKVLDSLHQLYAESPQKFQKLLDNVQVERWQMSTQDYRGLVEVPASRNPDAMLMGSGGHMALDKAPNTVRNIGRQVIDGLLPRAHRGIFYMDDFGRNQRSTDHLLMPLETGEVAIQDPSGGPGITKEFLDFIPMLSVNPEVLERARVNGSFEALEQRMLFVPVPSERRFQEEAKILEPIMKRAQLRGKEVAPGTLDAFALWTTMTRMFPINRRDENFLALSRENKNFGTGLAKLNPLGKALLYQGMPVPGLTPEEQEILSFHLKTIAREHTQSVGETEFTLYEGGVGMSSRAAMNILKQVTARPDQEPLSFIDMFEAIGHYVKNKPQYEKKRDEILKQKDADLNFPSGLSLLKNVEDYTRQNFMAQLKDALGMYQNPAEYTERIHRYLKHIQALQSGKSVDPDFRIDGSPSPDMLMISTFEKAMHPGKVALSRLEKENYRSRMLEKAVDWSLDTTPQENIQRLYQREIVQMRLKDEEQNQQYLSEFREHVKTLLKNPKAFEHQKDLPAVQRMEGALVKLGKLGYSANVLPRILDWALENRYIAEQVTH